MNTDVWAPLPLVALLAMATAAGLVGSFAVVRRMALAGDALSHVALPGIGVAMALHIHPIFGALAMLMFGAVIVWALEERTRGSTETVIGVVFSAALAVGSLLTTGDDLIDALFGGASAGSRAESVVSAVSAIGVAWFVLRSRHRLVVTLVSPDIARTAGVDVSRLNLWFLLVFALTIALGLRYLGVLLMGSLLIIPAATAKRLSSNLGQMLTISAVLAAVSAVGGAMVAGGLHREPGPIVVAIAAGCFLLSLLRRGAVATG
jgi:ABC-type Mn2+/Zn2+ transport system permease subunit